MTGDPVVRYTLPDDPGGTPILDVVTPDRAEALDRTDPGWRAQAAASVAAVHDLWKERQEAEAVYWAEVRALAIDPTLRPRCVLTCSRCHSGRTVGRVLNAPTGLLLVTSTPHHHLDLNSDTLTPGRARALYGHRVDTNAATGWLLDGPDTRARRLPWWGPGIEVPYPTTEGPCMVRCPQHALIRVDPDRMAVLVKSGHKRLGVAVDQLMTRV